MNSTSELIPAQRPHLVRFWQWSYLRGWSQRQFARILGRPVQAVNGSCGQKKQITPETAFALRLPSASPELWIGRRADYRLSIAQHARAGYLG